MSNTTFKQTINLIMEDIKNTFSGNEMVNIELISPVDQVVMIVITSETLDSRVVDALQDRITSIANPFPSFIRVFEKSIYNDEYDEIEVISVGKPFSINGKIVFILTGCSEL